MRASAAEEELTVHNVSIGVVSKDEKFHLLDAQEIQTFLNETGEGMVVG